jgi:hypothetical protein
MAIPASGHFLQASLGRTISSRMSLSGMYSTRSQRSQPISHCQRLRENRQNLPI